MNKDDRETNANLDQIESKYLDRQELSELELSQAACSVRSTNLRDVVTACAAILCTRQASEEVRRAAHSRFEEICADLCERDDGYKVDVLFALMQIPIQDLASSDVMKALAYSSVQAGRTSLRCNAVLVLERLHRLGDTAASSLIEHALHDADQSVRKNASVALGRAATQDE